jgi:hypothetical protein
MPGLYTDGEIATDQGSMLDYEASSGEAFTAGFERQFDTNPLALIGRQARYAYEDFQNLAGEGERVDQKTAQAEIASRGLDIKVPRGGMSRVELDMIQYLKQRERQQGETTMRTRGILSTAAGFGGGVAASLTDPINVASGFIPFVGQYRYAKWLAQAGEGVLARSVVRASVGAIEGAAGAALLEPIVYAGATSEQLDYGLTDSFMNVAFGGLLGGGLHTITFQSPDRAVKAALDSLDFGLRESVGRMPEHAQREILEAAVRSLEGGDAVDVREAVSEQLMLGGRSRSPDVANPETAERMLAASQAANQYLTHTAQNGPLNYADLVAEGFSFKTAEDFDAALLRAPAAVAYGLEKWGQVAGWEVRGDGASDTSSYMLFRKKSDVLDQDGYPVNLEFRVRVSDHANLSATRNPPDINYAPGVEGFADVVNKIDSAHISNVTDVADGELPEVSFDRPQARPGDAITFNAIEPGRTHPRNLAGLAFNRQFADDGRAPPLRDTMVEEAFARQFVDAVDQTVEAEKAAPKDKIEATKADDADWRNLVEEYRDQGRVTEADDAALKQADELAAWAERRAKAFEAAAACLTVA